jgi:hypothetical protein
MASPLTTKFQRYLQRATEMESRMPIVTYYIKYYVVDQLMQLRKQGKSDKESQTLLLQCMDSCEKLKKEKGIVSILL